VSEARSEAERGLTIRARFDVGDKVRFVDGRDASAWGDGVVAEIDFRKTSRGSELTYLVRVKAHGGYGLRRGEGQIELRRERRP
jgi:hypothetical protein